MCCELRSVQNTTRVWSSGSAQAREFPALFGGDADACFSHRVQRHSCCCSRRFAARRCACAYVTEPGLMTGFIMSTFRRLWFMLACCKPERAPHWVACFRFLPTRFGATTMQTRPNPLCPFRHFLFYFQMFGK